MFKDETQRLDSCYKVITVKLWIYAQMSPSGW
jgi:hypothetical protein